jgi:hypothetical protein
MVKVGSVYCSGSPGACVLGDLGQVDDGEVEHLFVLGEDSHIEQVRDHDGDGFGPLLLLRGGGVLALAAHPHREPTQTLAEPLGRDAHGFFEVIEGPQADDPELFHVRLPVGFE